MKLFSRNARLGSALRLSGWRKIAIGTWRRAGDPSIYGWIDVPAAPALAYIRKIQEQTGQKITLTHFFGRAIAEVLHRHPDLNCILRFGRLYSRETVDVFFQVATDTAGKDLSGVVIREANTKSLDQIALELSGRVNTIRATGDQAFKRVKSLMAITPGWLAGWLLDLTGYIMYTFNFWSPLLGPPRDPFGSVMVTSIGPLGLDAAFAPLVPYSRIPLLVAIGKLQDSVLAIDGKPTVVSTVRLCVTIDHRIIDGAQAAHMNRTLAAIMRDPATELEGSGSREIPLTKK